MTTSIARFRRELALYPVGVACLLVLYLLVVSGASPFAAGRSLIVAVVVGLACAVLGRLLAGDRDIGGLVGLLLLLSIVTLVRPVVTVVVLAAAILLVVIARMPEARRPNVRWSMVGTAARRVVSIGALAIVILAIQSGTPSTILRALERETPWRTATASTAGASVADIPDVYLILLDGYPRADVLDEVYGADGAAFTDALRARGFDVSTRSHSNYPVTALSLTSMFDMRHIADIPSIAADQGAGVAQGALIHHAINDGRGLAVAREHGYEVVGISGGFEQVGLREQDRFIDTGPLNEFEVQALLLSGLGQGIERVLPNTIARAWHDRIGSTFDAIADVATEPHDRPRLVFGHVPSPHAPWVDHADGRLRPIPGDATDLGPTFFQETRLMTNLSDAELSEAFTEQVAYVDARTLETVDAVLSSATRPSVVIVFSDHGPAHALEVGGSGYRLRNLFAARTPGRDDVFTDDQTLVNVLPRLWNAYLGTDLPTTTDDGFWWDDRTDVLDLVPAPDAP